jgi:Tol biopolymer transport system component
VKHAAVLALVLFLAACGSSGGSKPSSEAKNGPIAYDLVGTGLRTDGIYRRDTNGHVRHLTSKRRDFSATWSPDGKRIAFTRVFDFKNGLMHIYVMNADGSDVHQVGTAVTVYEEVSWSPDGRQIAFSDRDGVAVVNLDGSEEKTVAKKGFEPAWSPDGEEILFRLGAAELWLVRPDGSDAHKLLEVKTAISDAPALYIPRYPSWSPDGERIAFARTNLTSLGEGDKPTGTIVSVDKDGKNERAVAKFYAGRGEGVRPSWSPDGRYIAYGDSRSAQGGIYVLPFFEGGKPRLLIDQIFASRPSWGPAGT